MNSLQEESTRSVNETFVPGFSERLREAFSDQKNVEIARRLGVSKSAATNYLENNRVPKLEILFKASELTNCSLHWLLTGQGHKWAPKGRKSQKALELIELLGMYERIRQAFNGKPIVIDTQEKKIISDLTPQMVDDWETTGKLPPATLLKTISRLSHTSLYWLITGKGEKHEPDFFQSQPEIIRELFETYEIVVEDLENVPAPLRGSYRLAMTVHSDPIDLDITHCRVIQVLASRTRRDFSQTTRDLILESLISRDLLTLTDVLDGGSAKAVAEQTSFESIEITENPPNYLVETQSEVSDKITARERKAG